MAQCVVTFEDNPDGSIDTRLKFYPEIKIGDLPTNAQIMGMCLLDAIKDQEISNDFDSDKTASNA